MIKLYIFTFSLYSLVGTFDTIPECAEAASRIYEDYRYDTEIRFTMYCVDDEERHPKISERGVVQFDDLPLLQRKP